MEYFPDMSKPKIKKLLEQDHRKNMIKLVLSWFPKEMESELMKHLNRPGWRKSTFDFLWKRLHDELRELDDALFAQDGTLRRDNKEQIIKECADGANFLMMIADNAKRLKGEG